MEIKRGFDVLNLSDRVNPNDSSSPTVAQVKLVYGIASGLEISDEVQGAVLDQTIALKSELKQAITSWNGLVKLGFAKGMEVVTMRMTADLVCLDNQHDKLQVELKKLSLAGAVMSYTAQQALIK